MTNFSSPPASPPESPLSAGAEVQPLTMVAMATRAVKEAPMARRFRLRVDCMSSPLKMRRAEHLGRTPALVGGWFHQRQRCQLTNAAADTTVILTALPVALAESLPPAVQRRSGRTIDQRNDAEEED